MKDVPSGRLFAAFPPPAPTKNATPGAAFAGRAAFASRSYFGSPETRTQQLLKLVQAPQGASLARMLRRDGLEALAADAGGEEPRVLIYNPHPTAVKRSFPPHQADRQ